MTLLSPGVSKANTTNTTNLDPSKTFTPMSWHVTTQEVRQVVPPRLFERNTVTSLKYLGGDFVMAAVLFAAACHIDPWFNSPEVRTFAISSVGVIPLEICRWIAWGLYWWFQGLIGMGLWVIGHECGHRAFSSSSVLCDTLGFVIHSCLFTPYFSWRISHHRHHLNHNSMERDELYVPKTRTDLDIPKATTREEIEWGEFFADSPLFTLFMLVRQQLFAFPAYLLVNISGQKTYPWPTSHFNPGSVLFTKRQRHLVILSILGVLLVGLCVTLACNKWGSNSVFKLYGIPWFVLHHWLITVTYLHHTDPVVPHYRGNSWSYARGAASTVDRDFLGWQGRFFLHGISHHHVVHHFFPKMPHYHAAEATKYLREFLGEHYFYDDKPVLRALWDNYNSCQFVEDEGEVLFYRDKEGRYTMRPAQN